MNKKEQNNLAVGKAWELLYQRLEKDGLLPVQSVSTDSKRPLIHLAFIGKVAVAAVLVACIFAGWHFLQKPVQSVTTTQVLYNEAHAPTLATVLEDGSVVFLSGQTSLLYPNHFEADKREVTLTGDAFFEIKKQPERPFIIHTNVAQVEVTGTSFKIKSNTNASFLLAVREGEVRVIQNNTSHSLSVNAGETVFFDAERLQLKKSDTGFDDFFKNIHFKDEPLDNVATIINLHSDTLRIYVDPAIKKQITFTYGIDSDMADIVRLICMALDLRYSFLDNVFYILE